MSNDLMRIMRLADLQVFGVPRDEMNREQQPLLYKASERRTFHNQYRSDSDTTVGRRQYVVAPSIPSHCQWPGQGSSKFPGERHKATACS